MLKHNNIVVVMVEVEAEVMVVVKLEGVVAVEVNVVNQMTQIHSHLR